MLREAVWVFFFLAEQSQGFIANVCTAPVSAETPQSDSSFHDSVMSDASGGGGGIKASVFSDTPHSWHFSMRLSVESRVFLGRVRPQWERGRRSPEPPRQVSASQERFLLGPKRRGMSS